MVVVRVAIIGGTLGVLVIAFIVVGIMWYRKRSSVESKYHPVIGL